MQSWAAAVACGLLLIAVLVVALRRRTFLDPQRFKAARLIEKETITHNTKRFRFELAGGAVLGLPVGQHISFKFQDDQGRDVLRSYTPVTGNETTGHVDFVIKVYPQGKMSPHVDRLSVGDSILMRGPKGQLRYEQNMKRSLGMVAGGTGVTPMYQIIKHILRDPRDETQLSLLFANVSQQDILLKDELDDLARAHPQQLYVHYVIDAPEQGWGGSTGYVTPELMRQHCPSPGPDTMLLFCGPRPMTRSLESSAASLGFTKAQLHTF